MKNNSIIAALVLVLGLSSVFTAVLVFRYRSQFNQNMNSAREFQSTAEKINRTRTVVQALANESVEYSKTHPAIDPILQQFNLKPASAPAPAKPAARAK